MERSEATEALIRTIADAPQRLVADPDPAAIQGHIDDARTGLPLLERERGLLIDVGAGAGLPGLPILIERPDLAGVLLESRARRCDHLREAVRACGLDERVQVVEGRAETHAAGPGREAADIAVARALAPPPVALELCVPLVRPGGAVLLYTGAGAEEELDRAAGALGAAVERRHPTTAERTRYVVLVRRSGPLPDGIPRPVGRARKRPLVRPPG